MVREGFKAFANYGDMSRTGHENHEFHVVTPRYLRLAVVLPTFTTNSSRKMILENLKSRGEFFMFLIK